MGELLLAAVLFFLIGPFALTLFGVAFYHFMLWLFFSPVAERERGL